MSLGHIIRGGRYRRAWLRWQIQARRRCVRRGVCPCGELRIDIPGPHLAGCPWIDHNYPPGIPF